MISILKNDLVKTCIAFTVFLLLVLTSCTGSISPETRMLLQQDSALAKHEQLNAELMNRNLAYRKRNLNAEYKIGPEDLLDIDVFQVPELKTSVRVGSSGDISLPLIGKLKASGLTTDGLKAELTKKLRKKYLEDPVVTVFIREYRSQRIAVLGAVKTPQVFYVTGQKYLLDMLSMSGGLTEDAGNVCIVQQSSEEDHSSRQKVVIDLDELLISGNPQLNIPLFSGDIIHIPKGGVFFVDGAVKGPGSFPIRGKLTFTQAISMAKGLDFQASHDEMKIFRYTGKPVREVITVDYDAILKGKVQDIEIMDKDIIIVGANPVKDLLKGVSTGLNFGIVRFGKGF